MWNCDYRWNGPVEGGGGRERYDILTYDEKDAYGKKRLKTTSLINSISGMKKNLMFNEQVLSPAGTELEDKHLFFFVLFLF